MKVNIEELFVRLQNGDKRSAAQLMTLLENEVTNNEDALKRLYAMEGKSLVIGVTGWPGVGKSSLINRMAKVFLDGGKRVGIIAVDPTSALSGGGLLGDRIRLKDIEGKDNLFIRSMATRGYQGGLSRSARAFVKVMEVMGCEVVFLETVGTGQDQITVSLVADTTIVVMAPGLGDYLQAIKSGILEVGDIFVVNKADRHEAERTVLDLESAIKMREKEGWRPCVVKTVAADGRGIEALIAEVKRHAEYCTAEQNLLAAKVRAAKSEIRDALKARLLDHFFSRNELKDERMTEYAREICERRVDPYIVAKIILTQKGILS